VDAGSTPAASTISKGEKMNFLASKNFSLACAGINAGLAVYSLITGSWIWATIGVFFAWFCYNNYLNADD